MKRPLPAQNSPAMDTFSGPNAAVGANAAASSQAWSGSPMGRALASLYNTNPQMRVVGASTGVPGNQAPANTTVPATANTMAPSRPIYDPTLQGGQFPPGAPVVSGLPNSLYPSLANSQGEASGDTIQKINYQSALPPGVYPTTGPGAAANGYMAEGPVQPGRMAGLGTILQGLGPRKNTQQSIYGKLNATPPTAGLNMMFPSGVGGGGIL